MHVYLTKISGIDEDVYKRQVRELTFTPLETWGSRQVRLFGFEADGEFC